MLRILCLFELNHKKHVHAGVQWGCCVHFPLLSPLHATFGQVPVSLSCFSPALCDNTHFTGIHSTTYTHAEVNGQSLLT